MAYPWDLVVVAFGLGWTLRSIVPVRIDRCWIGHDWVVIGEPNLAIAHQWVQCRRCGVVDVEEP